MFSEFGLKGSWFGGSWYVVPPYGGRPGQAKEFCDDAVYAHYYYCYYYYYYYYYYYDYYDYYYY